MPNIVNEAIVKEYEEAFEGDLDALVVQPVGLSVGEVNAFRGRLAEARLRMQLVKGSLARRTLAARGLERLEPLFEGPAAFILADDEEVEGAAVTASRVVAAWRKQTGRELPEVKGGLMEGAVLDGKQAVDLASLPTREELQSRLLGQILSPASRLSSQCRAPGARIAGALKSHIDKLEQSPA